MFIYISLFAFSKFIAASGVYFQNPHKVSTILRYMQEKTANFIQKCRFGAVARIFFDFCRRLLYFLTGDGVDLVANLYEKLSGADKFADSRR